MSISNGDLVDGGPGGVGVGNLHTWLGELAGLLEPAALAVTVTLEHQAQAVEGQMPIVVLDGAQIRQHQRCGVTRGHDGDVVATEPVDVLTDAVDQPVNQTGESEHGAGLHAFDRVLADDRTGPGQFDAAQRRRPGRRGVGRHLHTRSDRTADASISRTQVTVVNVSRKVLLFVGNCFATPRSILPVRRNYHPLFSKRVPAFFPDCNA